MLRKNQSALLFLVLMAMFTLSVNTFSLRAAPIGARNQYLPIIRNGNPVRPVGGTCPSEMHLVHESSGAGGIQEPDTEEYRDDDYICSIDQSCDDVDPIAYGSCRELDGYAVFSCDEGYAGAKCDVCAAGYEPNHAGDACVPAQTPPSGIVLNGFDLSLEQGDVRTLNASLPGTNSFTWEITSGRGCFLDPNGQCTNMTSGVIALFQSPRSGDDIQLTEITVTPGCCIEPPPPPIAATVITVVPDTIPTSGWGDSDLEPILRALRDFMVHRCVGAATIGISYYGVPVGVWGLGRMNGAPAQVWDPDCGHDPFLDAPPVPADTPMSIGSISKSVAAAIARWQIHQTILAETGQDLAPDEIEQLHVFSDNPGLSVQFFPNELYDLYSGVTTPPLYLADSFNYGGNAEVETLCDTLTAAADEQWQQVTIGDLLGHRSGLQRSGPTYRNGLMPNIDVLRGLNTEADFQMQEEQLRAIYGDTLVDNALDVLGYGAGEAYFLPGGTRAEWLALLSGLCLRYDLGTYSYSNSSPLFWATIAENLGSVSYAAEVGLPGTHDGSALDTFFADVLGIQTSGADGIFRQQPAVGIPGFSYPGPVRRNWSESGNTYYPTSWDEKRPVCVWSDTSGDCDLSDWQSANPGRINWPWNLAEVPFDRAGAGLGAPSGSLRTEPEVFLNFMSEFWISGYSSNPRIGEERENVWNLHTSHNGSLSGGYAYAAQMGPINSASQWSLPPVSPSGHIIDDFVNLETVGCTLPDGVDIIVAVNQNTDNKCIDSPDYTCGANTTGIPQAYSMLDNFVLYGVCQVDWTLVMPTLPIIPPSY